MPKLDAAGAVPPARLRSVPPPPPEEAGGRRPGTAAPLEPRSLREIADEAGYTAQNVAALTGLHLSTILRHWHDPRWLEQFEGGSLQRLIVVVPGVDDYVRSHPQRLRQQRLADELREEGIVVDPAGVRHASEVMGIAPAFIGNALETTLHLARADVRRSISYVTTFWGCQQDRALHVLFSTDGPGRLLEDCAPLLSAANAMHEQLRLRRGAYMGTIIHTGDLAYARRYKAIVDSSPVARLIELWAFPTWARDRNATPDFTLERSLLLRHTAGFASEDVQDACERLVKSL
jgi:hypothetical protein